LRGQRLCRSSSRHPIPSRNGRQRCEGPALFAYADNYLVDVKFGVIVDVEASRAMTALAGSIGIN
jgi:hypothetical protein